MFFCRQNKLQAHFEEMKYSGEAKMSSGQRMLEEFQSHLEEAKQKYVRTYMNVCVSLQLVMRYY